MKQVIFLTAIVAAFAAGTNTAGAQDVKNHDYGSKNKKNEEIIIRRHSDADTKLTIETKDGEVFINGKPLSDFDDSTVTVSKGNGFNFRSNDMFLRPGGGNSFIFNDDNDGEPGALLGVTTENDDKGARINDVSKGSAAEKAGLKEGDIITKIGDKKIADPDDLVQAVRSYKPKSEVNVTYQRNGKAGETKAILGERKTSRSKVFSFNGDMMPSFEKNMKDFKFDMPPMPKQNFRHFWVPQNKKLGVKIQDTEDDKGARITRVEAGSLAEKAGLKTDDVITEVDGEKVKDTDDVRDKVMENEKSKYTVKARRGNNEMSFEIKIPKNLNSADL